MGFGIQETAQGIRNTSNDWNLQRMESSTWNPESTTWDPESKTVWQTVLDYILDISPL